MLDCRFCVVEKNKWVFLNDAVGVSRSRHLWVSFTAKQLKCQTQSSCTDILPAAHLIIWIYEWWSSFPGVRLHETHSVNGIFWRSTHDWLINS